MCPTKLNGPTPQSRPPRPRVPLDARPCPTCSASAARAPEVWLGARARAAVGPGEPTGGSGGCPLSAGTSPPPAWHFPSQGDPPRGDTPWGDQAHPQRLVLQSSEGTELGVWVTRSVGPPQGEE